MYGGQCFGPYTQSLLGLQGVMAQMKINTSLSFMFNESLITRARNALTHNFLKTDCSHLLFIDADISFEPTDVDKLLEADKDVVCSPYPKKYIKYESAKSGKELVDFAVSGKFAKISDNLYEIESVATGFLLIKRNVFQQMILKYPKIEYINDIDGYGQGRKMWNFFNVGVNPLNKNYDSEDWGFCTAWRNIGGKVYARSDISLGHWGWHQFKGNFNKWISENISV